MSWDRGSSVMTEIITCLMDKVPDDDTRQEIYEELIEIFESYDCDTLTECFDDDEIFEVAFKTLHSTTNDYYDDDDDDDSLHEFREDDDIDTFDDH